MSRQLVDPFIPITSLPRDKRPLPGLVNNVPRVRPSDQPGGTIMDVTHRAAPVLQLDRAVVRPRQDLDRSAMSLPAKTHTVPTEGTKKKGIPKHRVLRSLRMPAAVVFVMAGGVLIQSAIIGEGAIACYAVFAIWKKVPSRTSFWLALLSLISVVMLLLVKTNNGLAATFTTYTFLLLGVGVLGIIREMRAENV